MSTKGATVIKAERKRMVRAQHLLCPFLGIGDGVLDIGGDLGYLAQQYAQIVGPSGHVVCVEPAPQAYAQACAMNVSFPQVECVHGACDAVAGRRVLHLDQQSSARNSLWIDNLKHPGGGAVEVEAFTLDTLAARVRHLRAIKLDIQGAEWHALQGARETLHRPVIWHVEIWPHGLVQAGASVVHLCETFAAAGWVPHETTWGAILAEAATFTSRRPHQAIDTLVVRHDR